jgi:hypothetical protein
VRDPPSSAPPASPASSAPTARALADAVFVGWLPAIVANGVFVHRVHTVLDAGQSALHHLYDAGQMLGLAAVSWALVRALWRLPLAARIAAACALIGGASYFFLSVDLFGFLARHPDTKVPWRFVFAVAAAAGAVASLAAGLALERRGWRYAGIVAGLAMGVGNHLVLELNYPTFHLVTACAAACLCGAGALRWAAAPRAARVLRVLVPASMILALPTYAVAPGPVVRRALLGSSGAVAAPFLTRAWAKLERPPVATLRPHDPAWFEPRKGLPAIPAERLLGAPKTPIVILLTVDALRSDVVEGPVASSKSVPNFLAMGESSLRFGRVWATASYTMASLRALFLGLHYSAPRSGEPYLATLLEGGGVRTVNLMTHPMFSHQHPDEVCKGFGEEINIGKNASPARIVRELLKQLDEPSSGPLFLYSHVFEPHAPYDRGARTGPAKKRYVSEVSLVDAALGTLRRELRKRKLAETTYLIVTADHGEAFGEHGHYFHATTVYEEMIRVPLFIEGPRVTPRRSERAVSLIDLGPTILSLFGLDTPGHMMGQSLVPFMRGEDPVLSRPIAADGSRIARAMLFEERWKAIVDVNYGTMELYDLEADPGERRNLAERPDARSYFATLGAFFAGMSPAKVSR